MLARGNEDIVEELAARVKEEEAAKDTEQIALPGYEIDADAFAARLAVSDVDRDRYPRPDGEWVSIDEAKAIAEDVVDDGTTVSEWRTTHIDEEKWVQVAHDREYPSPEAVAEMVADRLGTDYRVETRGTGDDACSVGIVAINPGYNLVAKPQGEVTAESPELAEPERDYERERDASLRADWR